MIIGIDLFSGIGGLSEALKEYVRPIAYCERDRFCRGVLVSRMNEGKIPFAPVWGDVKTFPTVDADIIYGGFPCQDISTLGSGSGLEGSRSGLFFEIVRLVNEIRPTFVFLENVPAIRTRGLTQVIQEFSKLRYDCRWTVVSAAEVGAKHIRKRWFLLAYSNRPSGDKRQDKMPTSWPMDKSAKNNMDAVQWANEPNVGRVANGVSFRVDRIKCLGNSVVPLQAKTAFERLIGI